MTTENPMRDARDNMSNIEVPLALTPIAAFVRDVAVTLKVESEYELARLVKILGLYVSWASTVRGLPLAERLIFDRHAIDLYIRDSIADKKLGKSSVATYRSVLQRAAEVFNPNHAASAPRGVQSSKVLAPYTADDIARFRTWARGQSTDLRKQKARVLMCLGLGCGLRANEINSLLCGDISDGEQLTIRVRSKSGDRLVPMLPSFRASFRNAIAGRRPDDFVWGRPQRTVNINAISEFVAESKARGFHPNTYRMRTTWVVGRLVAGVHLPTLLRAAGLERLEKLDDYLPHLPVPTPATFATLAKEANA